MFCAHTMLSVTRKKESRSFKVGWFSNMFFSLFVSLFNLFILWGDFSRYVVNIKTHLVRLEVVATKAKISPTCFEKQKYLLMGASETQRQRGVCLGFSGANI